MVAGVPLNHHYGQVGFIHEINLKFTYRDASNGVAVVHPTPFIFMLSIYVFKALKACVQHLSNIFVCITN